MVAGKISTVYKITLLAIFCLFLANFVQAQVVNSVVPTNVKCFGGNDGEITVNVTGPGPYTYRLRYDFGDGSFNDLGTVVGSASNTITFKKGNGTLFDDAVGIPANVPPLESYVVTVFFNCGTVGCIRSVSRTITEPAELLVNIDDVDPDCLAGAGVGNGQIDISVSGGTGPYTIVWTGPTTIPDGTLSTASNLDAGNYSVTVTDALTCQQIVNIPVAVTTPAAAGPDDVACGTNSYTLSGNAFAAGEIGTWTGPAGVTFSPNANTPNAVASNLTVGNNILTWTITDAGFVCTGSSDNVTIRYSDVNIAGTTDVILPCFGATTAAGTFTVTGGQAPFTYTLLSNTAGATITMPPAGPTTSVSFTNGGAGIVRVRVQDNTGCTDQVEITITQPASAINITRSPASGTIALSCNGAATGSGSFTASGGTGAHTFTVTTNTTGGTTSVAGSVLSFTGAGAGTISVDVRDANNCLQSSTITITAPPALVVTPSPPSGTVALLCSGDTNGSGSFTASGGSGAHTFTVTGNTTGGTTSIVGSVLSFTGAGAGTISVDVRDANNCLQSSSITITAPPALVLTPSPATGTLALLCNGDTNGTGSFTASGGTGAHTFTVTGNTTGGTTSIVGSVLNFSGAGAGTISVDVRDANNCLQSSTITITAPPALVITPSPASGTIALLCNGDTNGTGNFAASGGTGAHTFTVTGNSTGGTTSIVGSVLSFTGAGAGTISVDVRDVNNCLQSSTITITAPPALVLTPSPATGTILLLCTGDTDGTGTFTASGGTGIHTFTVTGNTTGGTTSIVGSVLSFTGAGAGTISVDVRDANNCVQSSSITISTPPALVITPSPASGTLTLLCNGDVDGAGSFTASGGTGAHSFTVTGNTTGGITSIVGSVLSFSGAGAGTISVDVRDANNCLQSSSITITAPAAIALSNPGDITLTCSGGNNAAGTFTASGGTAPYTFFEVTNTTGATTSSTATAFSYTAGGGGTLEVRVEDANGCTQTQIITVTPASNVAISPTYTATNASCVGIDNGSITGLSATGGDGVYTFSIDGGPFLAQTSFTNLSAATHQVTARDGAGCTSVVEFITIATDSEITFVDPNPSAVAPSVCGGNDGSITVTGVTGGSGTYNYIINGVLTAAATGQPDNFVFTNLAAGLYQIEVEEGTGPSPRCRSAIQSVTVNSPTGCVLNCFAFTVEVDPQTHRPACNGGENGVIALKVTASAPVVLITLYRLGDIMPAPVPRPSGSVTVFSELPEGVYEYRLADGLGNVCIQSFVWDAIEDIQASVVSDEDSPCFGVPAGKAVIAATGSTTGQYFYSIDGTSWNQFVPGNEITGLPGNGTYNIRIGGVENDPCYEEVSVTIAELGTSELDTLYVSPVTGFPAISFPDQPTATRVVGIDGSGAAPYEVQLRLVDPPDGIEINPPFVTDWLPVDETSPLGILQKQVDQLYPGVYELAVRDAVGCERTFAFDVGLDDRIFIPNIFTPNKSDNINATFFIRNLPGSGSKLAITDRWGKSVFTSSNYNYENLWDGGDSPDGIYYYRLQIKGGKTYTGWVEILRGSRP